MTDAATRAATRIDTCYRCDASQMNPENVAEIIREEYEAELPQSHCMLDGPAGSEPLYVSGSVKAVECVRDRLLLLKKIQTFVAQL